MSLKSLTSVCWAFSRAPTGQVVAGHTLLADLLARRPPQCLVQPAAWALRTTPPRCPDVCIAATTPDQIEQVRHRLTGLVQDIRSKVHPLDFADDQLPGAAFFTERIHAQDLAFQGDRFPPRAWA